MATPPSRGTWRQRAWEATAPAPATPRDPNKELLETDFERRERLLVGSTSEELIESLAEWLVDPDTPPEKGQVRISKKLAGGGEPGRWLVIWGKGNSEGPYSRDVAARVLKARRQVSPAANAWMLNIDRVDLSAFDAYCTRIWVYPWLGKYSYFNVHQDRHGEVRIEGPRNLIEAKAYWLGQVEHSKLKGSNVLAPFVMDIRTGLPIFPKNYGAPPKTRTNPGGTTPALIRHMVVAMAEALIAEDPGIDDAELVSRAHAYAWSAAQLQGYAVRGTKKLTARGKSRSDEHAGEADAAAKDARYEALLAAARDVRGNPTGTPLSGRSRVLRGPNDVPEVIPFRGVVRDAGGKTHRPRSYLDPLDPAVQTVLAGNQAMRDVKRSIAHRSEGAILPLEVVPARRPKPRKRSPKT